MRGQAGRAALRRAVLAVGVLDGVDTTPSPGGVRCGPAAVSWDMVAAAVRDDDPLSGPARARVSSLLRLHAAVATAPDRAAGRLERGLRVVALPAAHGDHLGPGWLRGRTLGGALDLGLGVVGLLDDPDGVVALPPSVAQRLDLDVDAAWVRALEHVDEMAGLAVARLERDVRTGTPGILRPVGGCDVLALLASPRLRTWLARGDGYGMRAVAAPMRTRGWYDLAHVDPAFVGAAWSATSPAERGVPVPLLVTADEVGLARTPGSGGPHRAAGPAVRPRRPPS